MLVPFFFVSSVPVFADYDYDTYYIEPYQAIAYIYWNSVGFNLTDDLSNSNNIAVPAVRTDTGSTNDRFVCNASGTSYSCYYLGSSGNTGTFQYETTRAHNITEENISIHGAEIPWLSGSYIHDTSHVSNARDLWIAANGTLYISMITSTNPLRLGASYSSNAYDNPYMQVWSRSGSGQFTVSRLNIAAATGAYFNTYAISNPHNTAQWVTVNFPEFTSSTKIIPIYVGNGTDLDDSAKQRIGISTVSENYLDRIASSVENSNIWIQNIQSQNTTSNSYLYDINSSLSNGNSRSQQADTSLGTQNQALNNVVNQVNSIETIYNNDLNSALNGIDLDNDLVSHTGFTNAALWVSAQFNRMISGTPFELVMMFSLVTGLALVLIGKMRA